MKNYLPILLVTAFVGCKKDSSESATRTELITKATWKYDNAWVDLDKDGKADSQVPAAYLSACQIDNTITLKKDGTGTMDEGASKCNETDPQTASFTWAFADNEGTVSISANVIAGMGGDLKITTLNDSKLQLQKEVIITGFPSSVNLILDLKH